VAWPALRGTVVAPAEVNAIVRRRIAVLLACAFTVCCAAARAQDAPASPVPVPSTAPARTAHVVTLGGTSLHYTAVAGRTVIHDSSGQPTAAMFAVSYLLDGAPAATRPVTFFWNGGPGSATLWLHMGSFAPVRVPLNDTGAIVPPGRLVTNDDSLLPVSDLVFVDAPGTGYSKIVGKAKPADFYGVDQDAKAFTQFVENWLSANGRWNSPKFLLGESYGTMRAADVVNRLQSDGVGVNDVALIGSFLDGTLGGVSDDPRGCIAFLPTEAAVAWYHNLLPGPGPRPQLDAFLRDVRAFAIGPYASALLAGDAIAPADERQLAERMHGLTGLDAAYIEREHLCIDPGHFEKEAEREHNVVFGRYDGRFQGNDVNPNGEYPNYDPTIEDGIQDAFTSQFNAYVRGTLHFNEPEVYLPFGAGVNGAWSWVRPNGDYPSNGSQFPDVLPDLGAALIHNPALRVFSANGEFDLATPFFGTEFSIGQMFLPPAIRPHVTFGFYPSGHMIYLENGSRRQLSADLSAFILNASGP
jgi:carboxypeptidase C (cathepsin A)